MNVFAQNNEIEELEASLRSYKSGEEHYGVKHDKAYRLLSIDKYNNVAIFYLLSSFREMRQKDSIPAFFNWLIENNPDEVEPYLIREKYENYEGPTYTQRLNNLKEALKVDSLGKRVNYQSGKLYYHLFVREHNKNGSKANKDSYAANAARYFETVYRHGDDAWKEVLKFPLLQLANYSGDAGKKKLYGNYMIQTSYFPLSAFMKVPDGWETDYYINVIDHVSGDKQEFRGVESAIFHLNWYGRHLNALDEPALTDSMPERIYRFTYLRTFHNPVVIGLENNGGEVRVYWKVSDGAGGYEPGEIIEDKEKKLTIDDWDDFEGKINRIKFWQLAALDEGLSGFDGSQWILEGKTRDKYHVVDRWGGGTISEVCSRLIELTDLEIEDIY